MHEHDKPRGWIGVDFDGTLANYGTWVSADHCGDPIVPMVERVKRWLAAGWEVRVFTARIYPLMHAEPDDQLAVSYAQPVGRDRVQEAIKAVEAIRSWCRQHIGHVLTITCVKDYAMVELWDDRCVQVRPNTGEPVGESTRGLR